MFIHDGAPPRRWLAANREKNREFAVFARTGEKRPKDEGFEDVARKFPTQTNREFFGGTGNFRANPQDLSKRRRIGRPAGRPSFDGLQGVRQDAGPATGHGPRRPHLSRLSPAARQKWGQGALGRRKNAERALAADASGGLGRWFDTISVRSASSRQALSGRMAAASP